jgi:hypothetical protein
LARRAGRYLYIRIWNREKEKIKKSSTNYEAQFRERYSSVGAGIIAAPFQKGGFTHAIRVPAVSDTTF